MKSRRNKLAVLGALSIACAPIIASASTLLFGDDFNDLGAAARYDSFSIDNDTAVEPADPYDTAVDYAFNYGTFNYRYTDGNGNPDAQNLSGIPQAPRSTGGVGEPRIGVRLDANNSSAGTGGGNTAVINLFTKNAFSGNHQMTADVWVNYNGPFEGGSGSTEFMSMGMMQAGGAVNGLLGTSSTLAGYAMAADGERGNAFDFRFYNNNTTVGGSNGLDQEGGYVAQDEGLLQPGPADGRNQFYRGPVPNPNNLGLFPFQNPNDPNPDPSLKEVWYETPGGIGKHWTTVRMKVEDGIVYYYMKPAGATDYTLVSARTDESYTSGKGMIGYADPINGVAALDTRDSNDASFVVYDNIEIVSIDQVRPKWNVNASGTWADSANWQNGVPNSNTSVADFTDAISGSGKTITLDQPQTIRSMTLDNAQPYTFNATGTGKIVFDSLTTGILGTIKVKSGDHVINAPIDTNRILWTDVAGSNTLTINGVITGTSPTRYLKKTGTGTLVLGNNANAWTGDTRVEGGTLRLAANNAIPNNAFTTSVNTGATLDTNGFNFSTGAVAVNGGSIIGSGTITADSHFRSTGGGTLAANLNFVPTSGFTGNRELVNSNGPVTISGVISGAPKLHQYGTGTNPTIVLSGANTYTGATAVRGGVLVVAANAPSGAPGALGNSTTPVEVGDSTVTAVPAVRVATTASLTSGGALNGSGQFSFTSNVNTLDGVTLANGDRILMKNQFDARANGIWIRTSPTLWDRAPELDSSSEFQYGLQVTVTSGTTNAGRKYYLFDAENLVLNSSRVTWGQEIANASLLTGGPVTIGRDVNVRSDTAVAASVYTLGGNTAHASTFSGTINVNRNLTLTAATGGTVAFTGAFNAAGRDLTKSGGGTVAMRNVRANSLNITTGEVRIIPDGTDAGASVLSGLTIAGANDAWTSRLDLNNNDLVLHSSAANRVGDVVRITNQLKQGLNASTNSNQALFWTGQGIITSAGWQGGTNYTGIGVTYNDKAAANLPAGPLFTSFDGQTVDVNDVLVKYTWFGDADVDGKVTSNDYFQIDTGFLAGRTGWINGDFDYNGVINTNDYFLIDSAFLVQGSTIFAPASAAAAGVQAVPEPASLAGAVGASLLMLRTRRRRRRNAS